MREWCVGVLGWACVCARLCVRARVLDPLWPLPLQRIPVLPRVPLPACRLGRPLLSPTSPVRPSPPPPPPPTPPHSTRPRPRQPQAHYTRANGYEADCDVIYGDTDSVMVNFKARAWGMVAVVVGQYQWAEARLEKGEQGWGRGGELFADASSLCVLGLLACLCCRAAP